MKTTSEVPHEAMDLHYNSVGFLPDIGLYRRGDKFYHGPSRSHFWLLGIMLVGAVVVALLPWHTKAVVGGLDPKGIERWHRPLGEAQHVVVGRFRSDSPLQVMAVDRTPLPTHRRDANAWAILYLYDLEGHELWHREMEKGEWCIATRLIQNKQVLTIDTSMNAKAQFEPPYGPVPVSKMRTLARSREPRRA